MCHAELANRPSPAPQKKKALTRTIPRCLPHEPVGWAPCPTKFGGQGVLVPLSAGSDVDALAAVIEKTLPSAALVDDDCIPRLQSALDVCRMCVLHVCRLRGVHMLHVSMLHVGDTYKKKQIVGHKLELLQPMNDLASLVAHGRASRIQYFDIFQS